MPASGTFPPPKPPAQKPDGGADPKQHKQSDPPSDFDGLEHAQWNNFLIQLVAEQGERALKSEDEMDSESVHEV